MKRKKVEIGDIIAEVRHSRIIREYTIKRVTSTQAKCEKDDGYTPKFKREAKCYFPHDNNSQDYDGRDSYSVDAVGTIWTSARFEILTPEIRKEYEKIAEYRSAWNTLESFVDRNRSAIEGKEAELALKLVEQIKGGK